MAAALIRLPLIYWILWGLFSPNVLALPLSSSMTPHFNFVLPRKFVINNATGEPQVFNPDSHQIIPQGVASDGGGTGFDVAAIIWLAFCFIIGVPMAFAGIRGWRLTTGVGIGLSAAVCSWAAFNNSVNNVGVSDLLLTAIVLGFFFLGFVLGLFEIGRAAGVTLLGITGGLAFGIRIMIIKDGLLISGDSLFPVSWIVVALMGALGGILMVMQKTRRAGILLGSASVGTFLIFLGIDLVLNRQSGTSRGLRFLFDRNASHALDIVVGGYTPPLATQILLAVSLSLTPILAFLQHRIFKEPFSRKERPDSTLLNVPLDEKPRETQRQTFLLSIWDGAKLKSPSRFSL